MSYFTCHFTITVFVIHNGFTLLLHVLGPVILNIINYYTLCPKKVDHQLMAIILTKLNRFSNSFTVRKKSKL